MTTEKTPAQIRDEHRIIFYALLEAAMRYRESFWREDHELYQNDMMLSIQPVMNNLTLPMKKRAEVDRRARHLVANHKLEQEKFNSIAYGTLSELEKGLSEEMCAKFDNYATAYGLLADELAKAKNTTELLTVCKLYNEGHLGYLWDVNGEPSQHMDDIVADGDHLRTAGVITGNENF